LALAGCRRVEGGVVNSTGTGQKTREAKIKRDQVAVETFEATGERGSTPFQESDSSYMRGSAAVVKKQKT